MKIVFRVMVSTMIALIAVCVLHGTSFAASTNANMVFILDASGSMWGQVEGRAKMAIAKEVMADLIKDLPDGDISNTIANGKNTMGPYGSKIRVEDRWKVVMYVRALQRASAATIEDVPAENRGELGL